MTEDEMRVENALALALAARARGAAKTLASVSDVLWLCDLAAKTLEARRRELADRRHDAAAAERQVARRAEAAEGFEQWRWALGMERGARAFRRVRDGMRAISEYRRAHNQNWDPSEPYEVAVRVSAAVFAEDILHAAGPEQDRATVAWVVAGLSCRRQPFCSGCLSCQTVTAPTRPCVQAVSRW